MKRFFQNSVVVALSLLFLTTAGGFNVVHFCCKACADHGLRVFQTTTCSEVHVHHNHQEAVEEHCCEHHTAECTNAVTEHSDCCTLTRISVDNTIIQPQLRLTPIWAVFFVFDSKTLFNDVVCEDLFANNTFRSPPPRTGRIILSKNSTLII